MISQDESSQVLAGSLLSAVLRAVHAHCQRHASRCWAAAVDGSGEESRRPGDRSARAVSGFVLVARPRLFSFSFLPESSKPTRAHQPR